MIAYSETIVTGSVQDWLLALRARRISAVELLDVYWKRIAQYNYELKAIVTFNEEDAWLSARRADDLRARGVDGPLLGIPITVKETMDVRGLPTTLGIPERADCVASSDSDLVGCLRATGAVVLGKTNIPPYAADWQANNALFGRSRNPWDGSRTPGGSTGGGAAAVSAGLTTLEFGTDIAGSIRIPGAFCGVYGHKPSEVVLPLAGYSPGYMENTTAPFTVQGPLARNAVDLELAFEVMAQIGTGGARLLHSGGAIVLPQPRHTRLADYRVAVLPPIAWLPVDHEIIAAQELLIGQLRRLGVWVETIQPADLGDLRDYYALYVSILEAITTAGLPRSTRVLHALASRVLYNAFGETRSRGMLASAADYLGWSGQRNYYRTTYQTFFREWDVLLTPANIVNAFPHTDLPFYRRKLNVNGRDVAYSLQNVYPGLATLCGLPATVFPVGLTRSGLPVGLQVIGPYLEDRTTLRFVALVAREIGAFQPLPGLDPGPR